MLIIWNSKCWERERERVYVDTTVDHTFIQKMVGVNFSRGYFLTQKGRLWSTATQGLCVSPNRPRPGCLLQMSKPLAWHLFVRNSPRVGAIAQLKAVAFVTHTDTFIFWTEIVSWRHDFKTCIHNNVCNVFIQPCIQLLRKSIVFKLISCNLLLS